MCSNDKEQKNRNHELQRALLLVSVSAVRGDFAVVTVSVGLDPLHTLLLGSLRQVGADPFGLHFPHSCVHHTSPWEALVGDESSEGQEGRRRQGILLFSFGVWLPF